MKSFEFYTLKNGVKVVLVPMEGVESVAVGVYVKTGSRYETAKINGLSHFLEHMVFKGTKKFPTSRDTSYLEGLGAIQNAWTDIGATAYLCKIPSEKWRRGLEVAKELALYPTFPNKDLEIERGVILEEIRWRNDRLDEVAQELLMKTMFSGNGLGLTTLGMPEVIKRVTRDDFFEYHQDQYVAGRTVVVVAGKITSAQRKVLSAQIDEWFGGLPAGDGRNFERYTDKQLRPEVKIENKKLANQAHVMIGFRGLTAADPRRFASAILTAYLGQGLSSRLFLELREKRGLCYALSASDDRLEDTGMWGVYVGTGIKTLLKVVEAVLAELARTKEVLLTGPELEQAKEKVRGPLLFAQENPINRMEYFARQVLDRPEEVMDYDSVIDRLMGVTTEEIRQVARDIFKTEKLNLAVVGPVAKGQEKHLLRLLKL